MSAGLSRSSTVQDCWGLLCEACRGTLLIKRPWLPNSIPFASVSQRTRFRGKGLKGHSVAVRTARIVTMQTIPSLFLSGALCNSSYTVSISDVLGCFCLSLQEHFVSGVKDRSSDYICEPFLNAPVFYAWSGRV